MDAEDRERLGPVTAAAEAAHEELDDRDAVGRLWRRDHTLWQEDPEEVANRLGWLDVTALSRDLEDLSRFAAELRSDGMTHAVVLGMGGSSLFPEVLTRTFGTAPDGLELNVLDTTDPAAVRRVEAVVPLEHTVFVVSSKSGTTIETTSHLAWFWERLGRPGQFVAITDPGTSLETMAEERRFRRCFRNDPDIGGRYSALSYFGLVPAALSGVDTGELLVGAAAMAGANRQADDDAPALRLAAAMGGAARAGHDKLTIVLPPQLSALGAWVEQLIAESTGKLGTGILPVVDEPLGGPDRYGRDRLFVALGEHPELDAIAGAGHPVVELASVPSKRADAARLGAEVVRWELATALAGAVLGINPFDQPNVASAKEATAMVLRDGVPDIPVQRVDDLLDEVGPGDYIAIQAFVDPGGPLVAGLQGARVALRDRLRVATTVGIGPRYLHSTGQLHKGGPRTGVFLQVLGEDDVELPIPGQPFGFSALKRAQAAGDLMALHAAGLRAGRVAAEDLLAAASS